MLHVILQILAIIGIILLCILGLVLLLLVLVLFVPVRYRMNGSRYGEDMTFYVKATYLLHLLTVNFAYPEPASLIVKLFGIKIYDSKKKEAQEGKDASSDLPKQEADAKNDEPKKVHASEKTPDTVKETEETKSVQSENDITENTDKEREENNSDTKEHEEKRTLKEKIQYTFRSICDKIKNIIQKVKDIFANISYYKEVLCKIENQRMYVRVKNRVIKVLKSIRPRTIKADVRLGTGSPDTTAYIFGIYSMLRPVFGKNVKNIHIDLDFEEAVYEGTVFLKGKITLFTIALQAIRILLDKQVQIFIKQLKREDLKNGRTV